MTWPFVGSIGNQWIHPTLETDPDMHAKIDGPLNALAADIGGLPGTLAHFRAALRASVTTVVGTPVPFDTVLVDNEGWWNASAHEYGINVSGLYVVGFTMATTGARLSCSLTGIDSGLYGAGQLMAENSTIGSVQLPPTPIRFGGGESIYVNPYNAATTLAALGGPIDTCFFTIDQIGYL